MNSVKIQDKNTGNIFEFPTLDAALRNLGGLNQNGDRFEKTLLTTPSRRTFKEAHGLLERNGYRLYRDHMQAPQYIEVKIDVQKLEEQIKIEEAPADIKEEIEKNNDEPIKTNIDSDEIMAAIELLRKNDQAIMSKFNGLIKNIANNFEELNAKIEESSKAQEIVVKKAETGEMQNVGRQHYQFEILLMTIAARVNALLVGPAGSGKTSAAANVAKALNIPFYSISVGMQTTKTEFFGYMDATGKYIKTLFRQAFEHGGVFLLDEMDAGNANVLTAINQALANGYCAFPDGMITKHNDFVIVSSANTFGTGANREYVGRNQLDAATLDRFAVIEWNYDEKLENDLCANKEWLQVVRKARKNAETHKIRTVVSPRAAIEGAKLLAQGLKKADVVKMKITKGMNATEAAKIMEGTGL